MKSERWTIDVVSPPNEDGTTATVLRWLKHAGDAVLLHEPLLELETDKVTVEVASPAAGRLAEILAGENARVDPGSVLGRIEEMGSVAWAPDVRDLPDARDVPDAPPKQASRGAESPLREAGHSPASSSQLLSPAVRRIAAQRGIDPLQIAGSGRDGRRTARDLDAQPVKARRVPHSPMRRHIAQRVSESVTAAPHVTSVFEADLTRVLAHREAAAPEFLARGTKLTLSAYFMVAAVEAWRAVPEVNATYHEDALELHPAFNIGIGTALQHEGLIVPVIRGAEALDLLGLATELQRLTKAARDGSISTESVRGGTFTISNHGVSGSLLAAPIVIVQPQVAILGVGKLTRRPVVEGVGDSERVVVKPMCYITLTIDHRALDGFQANAFLSVLVRVLEQWPLHAP